MLTNENTTTLPIGQLPIDGELKAAMESLGCSNVAEILQKYTSGQLLEAPHFGIRNYKNFIQFLVDNNLTDLLVER